MMPHMPTSPNASIPASNGRPRRLLAMAAAVVIGLSASAALAQQQMNQTGGALDANNRVGSGGSNTAVPSSGIQHHLNNNIVTGNVTGGAGFRGVVPYRAPGEFRDFTAGFSSSAFAGGAAGVTGQGQLINNAQAVRPYYGAAQTVAPPAGFVRTPGTGGYLPPTTFQTAEQRLDRRIGAGGANALDSRTNMVLGGMDLTERPPESAFQSAVMTDVTMSFAPEALLRPDLAPELRPERGRPVSPYTQLARDTRMEGFTPQRIGDLRSELLRDLEGRRMGAQEIQQLLTQRDQVRQLNQDLLSESDPMDNRAQPRLAGDEGALRSPAERLADGSLRLASPAEQSAQYAQLLERLERFEEDPYAEALRPMITRQMQDQEREAPLPGVPSVLQPMLTRQSDRPGEPRDGEVRPGGVRPGELADPPVEVRSLTGGVSSPTLRQVYEQAEMFMAEGKFVSAIARYDAAERLVPNQPLTLLGRATAELGGGFFRQSAQSLRRAYSQNKELTMAQLDLNELIGPERLQEVAETLRTRAAADRQDVDSLFLLGFISYSTGNYEQASAFLELAHGRSQDPFFAEMRRYWALERPEEREQRTAPRTDPADDAQPAQPPVDEPGQDQPPVDEPEAPGDGE